MKTFVLENSLVHKKQFMEGDTFAQSAMTCGSSSGENSSLPESWNMSKSLKIQEQENRNENILNKYHASLALQSILHEQTQVSYSDTILIFLQGLFLILYNELMNFS